MVKKVLHYLDKVEDRIRARLSRYPIFYTLIGGVAIVLFWRGVWITADQIAQNIPPELMWLDGPISVGVSTFILLITGLFLSFFVNDTALIASMKQEKKIVEKTEAEVKEETGTLKHIEEQIQHLEESINNLDNK